MAVSAQNNEEAAINKSTIKLHSVWMGLSVRNNAVCTGHQHLSISLTITLNVKDL
jgi:hypothetical protein